MRHVLKYVVLVLLPVVLVTPARSSASSQEAEAAPSSASGRFRWPDQEKNGLILVNTNQYIATYLRNHPDWFTEGELILDFSVARGSGDVAAEGEYRAIRELLESKGLTVGTYTSGTTVRPAEELKSLPYETVPIEWMPTTFASIGAWPGQPRRKIIDVTDVPTRRALQNGIRRLWERYPAPMRFVDNAGAHSSVGGKQNWQATCANIYEIRRLGESLGCHLVFNVAVHVGSLSDDEAGQLIRAVGENGILVEVPWAPGVRASQALTAKAEARYRQLLDSGMTVIILFFEVPSDALLDWVATGRRPADHLYVGWPFWKKPWDGKKPWEGTNREFPSAPTPQ